MKTCGTSQKELALYAASALKESEHERIARHVKDCFECRDYLEGVVGICADHEQAALVLQAVEGFEESSGKITARVRKEIIGDAQRPVLSFSLGRLRWALGVGFAGVALFLFFVLPK